MRIVQILLNTVLKGKPPGWSWHWCLPSGMFQTLGARMPCWFPHALVMGNSMVTAEPGGSLVISCQLSSQKNSTHENSVLPAKEACCGTFLSSHYLYTFHVVRNKPTVFYECTMEGLAAGYMVLPWADLMLTAGFSIVLLTQNSTKHGYSLWLDRLRPNKSPLQLVTNEYKVGNGPNAP